MEAVDLRDMSETDLREHIAYARRDLFGLRFQHATGELDNTAGLQEGKAGDRPRADGRTTNEDSRFMADEPEKTEERGSGHRTQQRRLTHRTPSGRRRPRRTPLPKKQQLSLRRRS